MLTAKFYQLTGAFIATLAFGSAIASGQTEEQPEPGPAIGTKAPAFKLTDSQGTERSLAGYLKKGTVALVFYRSADW